MICGCSQLIASRDREAVSVRQSTQERLQVLRRENERLQEQIKINSKPANMIGGSSAMRSVYLHIEQVSTSQTTTVLIRGESGVARSSLPARFTTPARAKAGVGEGNCAALPDSIIEERTLRSQKGAFHRSHRDAQRTLRDRQWPHYFPR